MLVAFALGEGVKEKLPLVRLAVHEHFGAVDGGDSDSRVGHPGSREIVHLRMDSQLVFLFNTIRISTRRCRVGDIAATGGENDNKPADKLARLSDRSV